MGSSFALILLAALMLGMSFFVWTRERRQTADMQKRVDKMHASRFYADLAPMIHRAQKNPLEWARVTRNGISFRSVDPRIPDQHFVLREHGYATLSPMKLETLCCLIEQRIPNLGDHSRYGYRCLRDHKPSGEVDVRFEYTIRSDYKTRLIRAPYYDGRLQSQLW